MKIIIPINSVYPITLSLSPQLLTDSEDTSFQEIIHWLLMSGVFEIIQRENLGHHSLNHI